MSRSEDKSCENDCADGTQTPQVTMFFSRGLCQRNLIHNDPRAPLLMFSMSIANPKTSSHGERPQKK